MADQGLPDRLAKLIPLLGSDKSGEVAAAANAIEKTLRSGGMDWHDFVGIVRTGLSPRPQYSPPPPQPKPSPKPPPSEPLKTKEAPPGWKTKFSAAMWRGLAAEALKRDISRLSEKDIAFLHSALDRWNAPTYKQEKWMRDICSRIDRF